MALQPGSRLGPYEIVEPLGAGGMGEVWRARDIRLDREVALKALPERLAHDPVGRGRFEIEAKALAALTHPGIVRIFDVGEESGTSYVVTELLDGSTLAARLTYGPLSPIEACRIAAATAEALAAAHERRIVHRDLKPANIMLTRDGRVKILDFGVSRRDVLGGDGPPDATATAALDLTRAGAIVGTLAYMAPEQAQGKPAGPEADLFSLGTVLYEMLTGHAAFSRASAAETIAAVLRDTPPAVPEAGLPGLAAVTGVMTELLRKDPAHRPATASEVARRLYACADALGAGAATLLALPRRAVSDTRVPNNLPRDLSTFVGRGELIESVIALLSKAPLVTLTGPGGSGKTRLALRAASRAADAHPDGVYLVELAPLTDPEAVPHAAAAAIGVRSAGSVPTEKLVAGEIGRRTMLLVLDNCEHLIGRAASLAGALLRACPNLKILATSREPLGVPGESVLSVPPLEVADDPEQAAQSDAVALFVERAKAARAAFTLDARTLEAVTEICRRLDGLPLAIELAAARVRALSPEQILTRLGDRFALLTGGARTAEPRQRTLRAALDWSHDLLTPHEAALFRRLSVFAGGWTLEAAETVASGGDIEAGAVLDLLAHLADRSLIVAETRQGVHRARMLETVREYACEKLEAAGEGEDLQARHRRWVASLAADLSGNYRTIRERPALDALDSERDNLRAALERALTSDPVAALRMAVDAGVFWQTRGGLREGRRWLERAMARAGGASADLRAVADIELASVLRLLGDLDGAMAHLNAALAAFEEAGEIPRVCSIHGIIGNVRRDQGRYEEARTHYLISIELAKKTQDGLRLRTTLNNLGTVELDFGNLQRAEDLFRESLALSRAAGDEWGVASRLGNLAFTLGKMGRHAEAVPLHAESVGIWLLFDDRRSLAEGLEMLGASIQQTGGSATAVRLWGTAAREREESGAAITKPNEEEFAQELAAARAEMGEARFRTEYEVGRAMTPAEAVKGALGSPQGG